MTKSGLKVGFIGLGVMGTPMALKLLGSPALCEQPQQGARSLC
jgi:pyrroline-5-carboxylate reductase